MGLGTDTYPEPDDYAKPLADSDGDADHDSYAHLHTFAHPVGDLDPLAVAYRIGYGDSDADRRHHL